MLSQVLSGRANGVSKMPLQSGLIVVKQLPLVRNPSKVTFFQKENVADFLSCCSNPISGAFFFWEVEKIDPRVFQRKYAVH